MNKNQVVLCTVQGSPGRTQIRSCYVLYRVVTGEHKSGRVMYCTGWLWVNTNQVMLCTVQGSYG